MHRGVAAWRDGTALRIFMNSRSRLISLDAKTGQPVETFGDHGSVDLTQGLRWDVDPTRYTNTSPPVVYKDLIILGNGVGDRLAYRNDPPGDVRAFNARTGKQEWVFHTTPVEGDPETKTWGNDSWKVTGHVNVWGPFSVDTTRGLVYLPVTTPSNDYYGVHRPGDNLFADSIVCVDANTGVRKWHFQVAHHGLWDYDPPAAPVLVTMTVAGRRIDGVALVTKQGFVFVFDRVTGTAGLADRGASRAAERRPGRACGADAALPHAARRRSRRRASRLDDAFDLTPELKAQAHRADAAVHARAALHAAVAAGHAAAAGRHRRRQLGRRRVRSGDQPPLREDEQLAGRHHASSPVDQSRRAIRVRARSTRTSSAIPEATRRSPRRASAPGGGAEARGLPLVKPPYGELVAIDLNTGDLSWRVPFGDTPAIRSHPALAGVTLPARLGASGVGSVIATKSGLLFGAGGDTVALCLRRQQRARSCGTPSSRGRASSTPMTYRTASGRQFVVIASGQGNASTLQAFALK